MRQSHDLCSSAQDAAPRGKASCMAAVVPQARQTAAAHASGLRKAMLSSRPAVESPSRQCICCMLRKSWSGAKYCRAEQPCSAKPGRTLHAAWARHAGPNIVHEPQLRRVERVTSARSHPAGSCALIWIHCWALQQPPYALLRCGTHLSRSVAPAACHPACAAGSARERLPAAASQPAARVWRTAAAATSPGCQ